MAFHRSSTALSLCASLAAIVAVSLPTSRVAACSISCAAGSILPSGGDVPRNQLRFHFQPLTGKSVSQIDGGTSLPRLYRLVGPARVEVSLRVSHGEGNSLWITPDEPIPVGTEMVFEAPSCGEAPLRGEYTITPEAPAPTELGTLQATLHRENLRVSANASCSLPVDVAYADLTVKLSDSARPFAAVFDYQVFVDGVLHPEFSTSIGAPSQLPQGEERIYATCRADTYFSSPAALQPGLHRVRVSAKLDDKELQTPEIDVDLSCTGTPPAWEPDSDLAPGERPSGARDGGVTMAAGTDGAVADQTNTSGKDESGCALRGGDAARRVLPAWLAMLGLTLLWRRRRRA